MGVAIFSVCGDADGGVGTGISGIGVGICTVEMGEVRNSCT